MNRAALAAPLLAATLTACGHHSTIPAETAFPDCAIWGEPLHTVPLNYGGCSRPDDRIVPVDRTLCVSGPPLVRYLAVAWAFEGGGVRWAKGPLGKDAGYAAAVKECRG